MAKTKTWTWRAGLSGLAIASLLACGGRKSEPTPAGEEGDGAKVQETGKELSKNPLQAMQQLGQAAQKAQEQMQKAADRPPVEPVKFDLLLPILPEPVSGWTAADAQGSTTAMGVWKMTQVSRSYNQEPSGDEPAASVQIDIVDGGFVPAVYAPFHMMSQFAQESTEGYQKGVTVDGYPGFESWRKESKASELHLLVADRYIVHLRGNGLEPAALREWLGRMKIGDLAGLK